MGHKETLSLSSSSSTFVRPSRQVPLHRGQQTPGTVTGWEQVVRGHWMVSQRTFPSYSGERQRR